MFITIDGIEGAGKSSQVLLLSKWLNEVGQEHLVTKEPGTVISKECQQIRKLILSPENDITPKTEMLLFLADRAQHVEKVIRPALKSKWVVSDRYSDSTIVYQLKTRGLDNSLTRSMLLFASDGLIPDLTFILDLPAEIGLERAKKSNKEFKGGDRMELENIEFHKKLRQGFLDLSKTGNRYTIIDASKSIEEIHSDIKQSVEQYL